MELTALAKQTPPPPKKQKHRARSLEERLRRPTVTANTENTRGSHKHRHQNLPSLESTPSQIPPWCWAQKTTWLALSNGMETPVSTQLLKLTFTVSLWKMGRSALIHWSSLALGVTGLRPNLPGVPSFRFWFLPVLFLSSLSRWRSVL